MGVTAGKEVRTLSDVFSIYLDWTTYRIELLEEYLKTSKTKLGTKGVLIMKLAMIFLLQVPTSTS